MRSEVSLEPFLTRPGPFTEEEFEPEQVSDFLHNSKILIIGAGGLGCELLKDLSLSGFKNIHIIDMDTIDLSNLNRQFLFRPEDIGKSKAIVASQFIQKRIKDISITPYFGKIQDKPSSYYKQFRIIICGLDSVEARRWINATLVQLVDDDDPESIIPIIDGGTEGFKGQSRVILPTISSCYECSLDILGAKKTFPICTIANTPRLPEHCIEWCSQIAWPKNFPDIKLDSDNPEHVNWIFETATSRAKEFNISGITYSLTLGVIKNIIPSIASTNAIIAASCSNEALKLITACNPILNNYMMYSGNDSIYAYTFEHMKRKTCPVCGNIAIKFIANDEWTLDEFIEKISIDQNIVLKNPSLRTATNTLYMAAPPDLEEQTRSNLQKQIKELIMNGEEVVITDLSLPISSRIIVYFKK